MTNKLRHQILGLCVLILFGMYLCVICSSHADSFKRTGESFLRLSILLGVVWLAWDDLLSLPRWLYIFAPIIILAVVVFPRVAPIVILILVPLWLVLKFLKFITQPLTPQQRGPKRK
jgi:hypothetical protein